MTAYNSALQYNTGTVYGGAATPSGASGYKDWAGVLNQLAGTNGLGTAGAANVWAGTVGLETVAALNRKANNALGQYREINGVCNQLAGTTGMEAVGALNLVAGNSL